MPSPFWMLLTNAWDRHFWSISGPVTDYLDYAPPRLKTEQGLRVLRKAKMTEQVKLWFPPTLHSLMIISLKASRLADFVKLKKEWDWMRISLESCSAGSRVVLCKGATATSIDFCWKNTSRATHTRTPLCRVHLKTMLKMASECSDRVGCEARTLGLQFLTSPPSSFFARFSLAVFLLNQWWTPPLRLQVSHYGTFLIICTVPRTDVLFFAENVLKAFLALIPRAFCVL